MVYLGRRVSFSMAHRMHRAELSDDENRALYGKCNNPNGHGHQYTLEVLVKGRVDPATGFSIHLPDLDALLQRAIVEPFDHRDFDRDFPEYADVVSSGESLARVFWDRLAPHLPALVRVRVEETEKNAFEYPLSPKAATQGWRRLPA